MKNGHHAGVLPSPAKAHPFLQEVCPPQEWGNLFATIAMLLGQVKIKTEASSRVDFCVEPKLIPGDLVIEPQFCSHMTSEMRPGSIEYLSCMLAIFKLNVISRVNDMELETEGSSASFDQSSEIKLVQL
ncbi:unnamed protein product [Larinioides sclopetarius]|uniref:Uncharacterized protein n=1 Tax=Larinioides sclopetarius TaxID=280406 RepID=A0AAV1ZDJ2_9ARAC